MSINRILKTIQALAAAFSKDPRTFLSTLRNVPAVTRGFTFARDGRWGGGGSESSGGRTIPAATENPLRKFFEARQTGRGIWKCEHYFDIYQRHFSRFVGREVGVLEIGVYSGGSLDMWRSYFGTACTVYGWILRVHARLMLVLGSIFQSEIRRIAHFGKGLSNKFQPWTS